MLLQPDSKLFIVPAAGGKPRLMKCNTGNMNSWHSWSPNGKWLVFSSKKRGPYTQLYLTHINNNGNDTPPVFVENLAIDNLASNIPEFINIKRGDFVTIKEKFIDEMGYDLEQPKDFSLYKKRADNRKASGDYQSAANDYSKAIDLNPDNYEVFYGRGFCRMKLNDTKNAIEDFNKAISINNNSSDLYFARGIAKNVEHDIQGAIEDLDYAIMLNNKFGEAYFIRGLLKIHTNNSTEGCLDLNNAYKNGYINSKKSIEKYCGK
jgi:tetratricopeptide (TPR) repeat protein